MPAKDPRLYLIHIRECCEPILDYTGGIESTWPSVPVVNDAVCRNLEIIGEAARRFDDAFRVAHTEIPWRSETPEPMKHPSGRPSGRYTPLADLLPWPAKPCDVVPCR